MARLEPCPGCQRHVRVDEESCPFCAARLGTSLSSLPARTMPSRRLGRAALFAFGVSAAATAAVGCSDEPDPDEEEGSDAGARDGGVDASVRRDAGAVGDASLPLDASAPRDASLPRQDANVAPVYGAPAWDSAVPDARVPSQPDARVPPQDDGGFIALYGLAPMPEDDEKS
jgi:hypothetical protein